MSADDSADKPVIDADLVRRLIAEQFPQWSDLPVRPVEVDGWDNCTFHLGEMMSVRLPSASRYMDQVDKEQHWLPILRPQLPLDVPQPLAMGEASDAYPWAWSVYGWLAGENASMERISDPVEFANSLGHFLTALQAIDTGAGPPPGQHNFYRGGPPATYDAQTREAVQTLQDEIDTERVLALWETALDAHWNGPPVWVHGDVAAGNLLVTGGRLSAVIDFGCSAVGDPACDLTIAWTFFAGSSREAFRAAVQLDDATWARARGWALWKALIICARHHDNQAEAEKARQVVEALLEDNESR
jgi:aminoglycoside phosphotransferase (APT) family kinase protein